MAPSPCAGDGAALGWTPAPRRWPFHPQETVATQDAGSKRRSAVSVQETSPTGWIPYASGGAGSTWRASNATKLHDRTWAARLPLPACTRPVVCQVHGISRYERFSHLCGLGPPKVECSLTRASGSTTRGGLCASGSWRVTYLGVRRGGGARQTRSRDGSVPPPPRLYVYHLRTSAI